MTLITQILYWTYGLLTMFGIWLVLWLKFTFAGRRLRWWIRRRRFAEEIFLKPKGGWEHDLVLIYRKGNHDFFDDGENTYGFEPIADGLGIVETGNALPVVSGGWIEQTIITDAISKLSKIKPTEKDEPTISENVTATDLELDESKVTRVYKWVYDTYGSSKLRHCLIRPFTKWSSGELYHAIHTKVVEELFALPQEVLKILTVIAIIGVAGIVIYFGYTQGQALAAQRQILDNIAKNITSPYTPLP